MLHAHFFELHYVVSGPNFVWMLESRLNVTTLSADKVSRYSSGHQTSSRCPFMVVIWRSVSMFQTASVQSADADSSKVTSLETARSFTSRRWAVPPAPTRPIVEPAAADTNWRSGYTSTYTSSTMTPLHGSKWRIHGGAKGAMALPR